jgi:hypothetical protein
MFTWDDKPSPFPYAAERRQQMYRHELEERAALLMRLCYPAAEVKRRLRARVAWDFELHAKPPHAAEVDKIVDAVYKRNHK